jgi:chromosomal replication initiation ATPase DnaA
MNNYISVEADKLQETKQRLTEALLLVDTLIKMEDSKANPVFEFMTQQQRIEHIMDGVADFFQIPRDQLKTSRRHSNRTIRKKYISALLAKYANVRQEIIADMLGYGERSSVSNAIDKLDTFLAPKPFGEEVVKEEWKNLLLHLKLNNYKRF